MAAIPKFLRNFGFPLHSRGNTGVNEVIFVSKSPGGQWPPLRVFCQFFEFCNRPIEIFPSGERDIQPLAERYLLRKLRYRFAMILNYPQISAEIWGFLHIFEENISPAMPISHAARRISPICIANRYHCVLCISLCATR